MANPKTSDAGKMSLAEFAEKYPGRPSTVPWITTIPEYEEAVEAFKAGMPPRTIRRWLADSCGYGEAASESKVSDWLRQNVTRDA